MGFPGPVWLCVPQPPLDTKILFSGDSPMEPFTVVAGTPLFLATPFPMFLFDQVVNTTILIPQNLLSLRTVSLVSCHSGHAVVTDSFLSLFCHYGQAVTTDSFLSLLCHYGQAVVTDSFLSLLCHYGQAVVTDSLLSFFLVRSSSRPHIQLDCFVSSTLCR
jgi:hypothetical protein